MAQPVIRHSAQRPIEIINNKVMSTLFFPYSSGHFLCDVPAYAMFVLEFKE